MISIFVIDNMIHNDPSMTLVQDSDHTNFIIKTVIKHHPGFKLNKHAYA